MTPEEKLFNEVMLGLKVSYTEPEKEIRIIIIRLFKSEVCKQQRERCCEIFDKMEYIETIPGVISNLIRNTAEPE